MAGFLIGSFLPYDIHFLYQNSFSLGVKPLSGTRSVLELPTAVGCAPFFSQKKWDMGRSFKLARAASYIPQRGGQFLSI
jgi:hypothetical protein